MATAKATGNRVVVEYNRTRIFGAALQSATKKALRDAAAAGAEEAKRVVPVDTGNLRASITGTVEGDEAVLSSDVDYAPYVEYGTRYMHARPYMRPGFEVAAHLLQTRMLTMVATFGEGGGTPKTPASAGVRTELRDLGGDQ